MDLDFKLTLVSDRLKDAEKTLKELKKIKKLNYNPLDKEIDKLISKVDKLMNKYKSEYDVLYKLICEEADFLAGM